jgi:hypothetical protein
VIQQPVVRVSQRPVSAGPDYSQPRRLIADSLQRLERWIEEHDYRAYEPFDGLSSRLRPLTFGSLFLDRLLMQAVRQSPLNLRPLLGIKPLPSTKGQGYMAAGYLTMFAAAGDPAYYQKAVNCLEWLAHHKSPKFEEYSWANHFDFASRGGRYSKDESIIVWTALIGHAFLDGFEASGDSRYLRIAESASRWILALPRERTESGTCISYHALDQSSIHNANMLGAAFLARCWRHLRRPELLDVAAAAMRYSCSRQLADGAWWYAEAPMYHWIDNFHTGYNLDSLKTFIDCSGDRTYERQLQRGFEYYVAHFFEPNGCPRYYHNRTQPIDSQCAAQSIETLTRFAAAGFDSVDLACRTASWWITNMQDPDGHFYYRMYPIVKAKMPMLHWAQATTYRALALLHSHLASQVATLPS